MRVFVAVQPAPNSGASSLSRYIAQSKVDRDRERVDEKGSRPLFSEREDNLTYNEADRLLNPTSGELEKEDVIHVVISPEPGSFERAGETDEERKKTFREAIRDAVREIARELKVRYLNWVGGLHGNTRTPHGHLAVSRWAIDEKTGKLVYIKHLPESLLPRNLAGEDGTKRFSTGKIAEFFANSLKLRRKPVRFVQMQFLETGIEMSRSILSPYAVMLREPTNQERLVGHWIEAELTLSRALGKGIGNQDELTRDSIELRGLVAELDSAARAQGAKPTAAYIEPEKLEELIKGHNGGLRVNIFTELPQGDKEKYVERTSGPATSTTKEPSVPDQVLDHNEGKGPIEPSQLTREPSPASAGEVKLITRQEAEGARQRRAPSARSEPQRSVIPRGTKAVDKVETTPRVATKTLDDLRRHMALSQKPDAAINKAVEPRESIKEHQRGPQRIGSNEGAQSVATHSKAIPAILSVRTERAPADSDKPSANLTARKEPTKQWLISDEWLASLAQMVRVHRLYMESKRDITPSAPEKLDSFEFRLRELILIDNMYDEARRKRNLPTRPFGVGQDDLLKGRESLLANQLKRSLPDEMQMAKETLPAVAPLANPSRVNEYNRYQEEKRALIALKEDREKQTFAGMLSSSGERPEETLDSHSTITSASPGKEASPTQALVEEVIELIL